MRSTPKKEKKKKKKIQTSNPTSPKEENQPPIKIETDEIEIDIESSPTKKKKTKKTTTRNKKDSKAVGVSPNENEINSKKKSKSGKTDPKKINQASQKAGDPKEPIELNETNEANATENETEATEEKSLQVADLQFSPEDFIPLEFKKATKTVDLSVFCESSKYPPNPALFVLYITDYSKIIIYLKSFLENAKENQDTFYNIYKYFCNVCFPMINEEDSKISDYDFLLEMNNRICADFDQMIECDNIDDYIQLQIKGAKNSCELSNSFCMTFKLKEGQCFSNSVCCESNFCRNLEYKLNYILTKNGAEARDEQGNIYKLENGRVEKKLNEMKFQNDAYIVSYVLAF